MLVEQQLGQRALRALDLGREHGLLADVRIEELLWIGQEQRDSVEPTERLVCPVGEILERLGLERRIRRERLRVEDEIALVAGRGPAEHPGPGLRSQRSFSCARHN